MKRAIAAPQGGTTACWPAHGVGRSFALEPVLSDPMRRFLPCPYVAHLSVAGRTLRLETNSPKLLEHMIELFACYSTPGHDSPEFLWRIIVEPDSRCSPPWPRRSTFSDEGIRFAQFGERNFLAVDLDAREAIGFVAEGLFDDAPGFTSPFIDTLFYMTSGALGLVPFSAASVRSGASALLVLGAPNQGKTTASYYAAKKGLTIHADQSVFLEIVNGELRAWGDFVPLAFRPEALQYLPELSTCTLAFSYCDFNFYYMRKRQSHEDQVSHVTPTCCVVLERGASATPCLDALATRRWSRCLSNHIAFKDDHRFEEQQEQVVAALAGLPAYRLRYDSDPANVTPFLVSLLSKHGRL